MDPSRIAVVDDEAIVRRELARVLEKEGYKTESFADGESALSRLAETRFDLLLCDLRLPGVTGMDVLRAVRAADPAIEVIILTGFASVDSAIAAIRAGAYHYVTKPLKMTELKMLVQRALEKVALVREKEALKQALFSETRPSGIIGHSQPMQQVFRLIEKVAPLDCSVLIEGESGTGKEVVARALHEGGPRQSRPFVSFNCGGFTEDLIANELFGHEKGAFTGATSTKVGLLEAAHTGSILLDEIGEMPASMQVKLLRFVEERTVMRVGGVQPVPVDVRLIAASNRDLKEMVRTNSFREDLYYRLNVVVISLPPLRDRLEDLPLLVEHFLRKYGPAFGKKITGVSQEILEVLSQYPFPGNVRELGNIIERAVALSDHTEIGLSDLPSDLRELSITSVERGAWPSLEERERDYIRKVLALTDGHRTSAAEILGIPRTTLWRKMKRLGID
jgi:two-component system response regulator AtoC